MPQKSSKIIQNQIITTGFSGPIPDPNTLQRYESIKNGLADRIVSMAERQSEHRQALEKKSLDAEIKNKEKEFSEARLGQIFALIIGLTAIICGTFASFNGAQWFGSIIGGGGVIGLVSVFILGRKTEDNKS